MIKAWIKGIIRDYILEERNSNDRVVGASGPPVVNSPAIIAHSIRNGYILAVHTNPHYGSIGNSQWGDYVFCKDNDELAAAIIAEFTKNKMGIPTHVQTGGYASKQAFAQSLSGVSQSSP